MTPTPASILLLNIATLGYLFATVAYILYFISRKKWTYVAAPLIFGLSLAAHATALGSRWIQGGLYRPPWTNLYESLVYFSFGLAMISLIVDLRFRVRYVGAFTAPLVFSGLGLAFLVPVKEITPLVPSLQSYWILAHSCLAAFAYSGFIVSSVLAFLYLVKAGMEERSLVRATGFIGLCFLLLVGGTDVFLHGKYLMTEMVYYNSKWIEHAIPGSEPTRFFMIEAPLLVPAFWMSFLFYGIACVLSFVPGDAFIKRAKQALTLGAISHFILIGIFIWFIDSYQSVTLGSNPYSFTLLVLFAGINAFTLSYLYSGPSIAERLPEAKWLDQLSYQVTLFAFPFMTLILITGAIWAHEAWGRFWGWDPKETTALVTWMIYAAYLHSRFTQGWSGKRSAVISIIGFFSVIFTYLGTNLVLSGLHSYGAK